MDRLKFMKIIMKKAKAIFYINPITDGFSIKRPSLPLALFADSMILFPYMT